MKGGWHTENEILEQLYRRYYSAALLYCLSLCGNQPMAEDLVAEAFVKAYLSLPDEIPSFQYWLFRVCRNLWLDHCRRNKHLAEKLPAVLPDHNTPETRYLANEQQQALWNAIAALSPLDRELVTLHYFSGLPLKEAAQVLSKSYPAARQRMVRLRAILKLRMEEQGYGKQ